MITGNLLAALYAECASYGGKYGDDEIDHLLDGFFLHSSNLTFNIKHSTLKWKFFRCIEARACLRGGARQVTMTHYLSLWKRDLELAQQIPHCVILGPGKGVGRTPLVIQPALVADADGAAVVGAGM